MGEWMWQHDRENRLVFPPTDFSIDDEAHIRDMKVLVHQMIQQQPRKRVPMERVLAEVKKIRGECYYFNIKPVKRKLFIMWTSLGGFLMAQK